MITKPAGVIYYILSFYECDISFHNFPVVDFSSYSRCAKPVRTEYKRDLTFLSRFEIRNGQVLLDHFIQVNLDERLYRAVV